MEHSSNINKEMLEIKKKIQLSEGQRKAAFEDCEAERKTNIEDIKKLKSEIKGLVKDLNCKTKNVAGLRNLEKKLEQVVGPLKMKKVEDIEGLLNLQIIDKNKALDLVHYQMGKKHFYLNQLGDEYQKLISEKSQREILQKVDKPNRKTTCDLQNNIHAVEIQLREATHISTRYNEIKKSLLKDASRFESNIKKIEEELKEQKQTIEALQKVMNEATEKRSSARGNLLKEEKLAMLKLNSREKQSAEGRTLVTKRKKELELLEKKIFLGAKSDARPADDQNEDEEFSEIPMNPEDQLAKAFEVLKRATGATNSEEVFEKFNSQRETLERLVQLREKSEEEKRKLERKVEDLESKLEFLKYAQDKDVDKKANKMEELTNEIKAQNEKAEKLRIVRQSKNKIFDQILATSRSLLISINPLSMPLESPLLIIKEIQKDLSKISSLDTVDAEVHENLEEKWLPPPYNGLVRRTPIPQAGTSPAPPPPPESGDEEEVPSRTYLKRQAQLVVDAKSRRKNIRFPQKRN